VPTSCCSSAFARTESTEVSGPISRVLPVTITPDTSGRISAWISMSGSIDRSIVLDLQLREAQEGLGTHAVGRALRGRHLFDDRLRLLAQSRFDTAIELDAQRQEILGLPRIEHLELQVELPVLAAQELGEQGIVDAGEIDVSRTAISTAGSVSKSR
jgi:hypothetical protein